VYRYNGLGYRIQWQYDENINFTLSSSERFYFLYDDRWRIVATFRDTDSSAKESFVYHAAGVAGRGGSSYIDSVILRDKDANTGWTSAADGTLEDRVFYAQNWRADVVALTKDDGQPTEFIRYTSYGVAQAFAAADVNRDGTVNSADSSDWNELYTDSGLGNAAIPVDFDFDGSSFNPDDLDAFNAAYTEASGWSNGGLGAGGGKLSRIGNRKGYAGYEYDPAIVSYHVRHRVYLPEIGRWNTRDPLGYVDGMSVYEYVSSRVVVFVDDTGMDKAIGGGPVHCLHCCGTGCCNNCGGESGEGTPTGDPIDPSTGKPLLGHEKCCSRAARNRGDAPMITVCCGKVAVTCSFVSRPPPIRGPENPLGCDAGNIIYDCMLQHEDVHKREHLNCGDNNLLPDFPQPYDGDRNEAECEGYEKEAQCLQAALSRGTCTDSQIEQLQTRLNWVIRQRDAFCSAQGSD
jgi:RHS repeat-associated protein